MSSTRPSPATSVRLLALALVAGCSGGTQTTPMEDPVPTSMTVTAGPVTMTFLAETVPLLAQVRDQNGGVMQGVAVTWTTDDASVATVSDVGIARAIANGSTRVTATAGSLTGTVDITVAQVAAGLFIISGNAQEAIRDSTLALPVVVRAQDLGGAGVEGTSVTFVPEAGDGTVSADTVMTDANGEAQTMWTLGSSYGPHRLDASIGVAAVQITAIARAEVPTPDLAMIAPLTIVRADPSSLEAFVARTTIKNEGDAASGVTTRVALLAAGSEIATLDLASLDPNAEQMVEFAVGPMAAGQYQMTAVADADSTVVELNEENNEATRALEVVAQTATGAGTVSGLSAQPDDELLFRFEMPAGPAQLLTIEVNGASGDADLFIEGGNRPGARTGYDDCVSAGPTSNERCQIVGASGTYHILIHAWEQAAAISNASLTITVGGTFLPYDLELVFVDNGTPSQDSAFLAAADELMTAIIGDVPDYDFSGNPLAADFCVNGQPQISGIIDDLRIYVVIEEIDGPLGTLASAGPCATRGISAIPIVGLMRFDQDDLERLEGDGDMYGVVLHEMAHVLGLGTIWPTRGLLQNPSQPNNQGADTHFNGERAIAAFDAAGGAGFSGSKVPVENMAGPGSADGHWRESVMVNELMTPFLNAMQPSPMSAITIESFADLGYGVDISVADPFTVPNPSPPRILAPGERVIDLSGDLYDGPVRVYYNKGPAVEIRR